MVGGEGLEPPTLSVEKQKDGSAIDPVYFTMEAVELGRGIEPVSTLVPAATSSFTPIDMKDLSWSQISEIFKAIDEAYHSKKPWSVYKQARRRGRYAPDIIAERWGISEQVALNYLEQWQMNDHLEIAASGYKGRATGLRVIAPLSPIGVRVS